MYSVMHIAFECQIVTTVSFPFRCCLLGLGEMSLGVKIMPTLVKSKFGTQPFDSGAIEARILVRVQFKGA